MLARCPYLAAAAVLLFLPAYAVFSDTYTGSPFSWLLQGLGNVVHLGWIGVPLLVGGLMMTTLAVRTGEERDDRALG